MVSSNEFRMDIENSVQNCKRFIYPILRLKYGNAVEILSLEEVETPLARNLDKFGNDVLVVTDDETFFINSRCLNYKGYLTFTIRKDRQGRISEYDRIKNNIERGGVVPKIFAQCYLQGNYAKIGVISTSKLFKFITKNINDNQKVVTRQNGNADFFSIDWRFLKNNMETFAIKDKDIYKVVNDIPYKLK